MRHNTPNAKSRLLDAVGKLLREHQAEEITVRQIASMASVNIAAINYHFQSKENLIAEAVEMISYQGFREFLSVLQDHSLEPATRIKRFLQSYATLCVVHPNIAAYQYKRMLRTAGHKPFAQLDTILTNLVLVTGEIWPAEDEKHLHYTALQLLSAVMMPFLLKEHLAHISYIQWQQYTERCDYISALVDHFVQTRRL